MMNITTDVGLLIFQISFQPPPVIYRGKRSLDEQMVSKYINLINWQIYNHSGWLTSLSPPKKFISLFDVNTTEDYILPHGHAFLSQQ